MYMLPTGTQHQADIMDESFTRLGDINGLRVCGNYLYVASEFGVGKFLITYKQSQG